MLKLLLSIVFGVAIISLAPHTVRAQPSCWGSSLVYIVRDEHGKPISADHDDLWIGPGWEIADYDFGEGWVELPESLRKEIGNLKFLAHIEKYEPCHFTKPIELRLTLHGKNMNLIFHAENKTRLYVDSLPFQPGTFEHQLPREPREKIYFWSAEGWKKTGEQAAAVAPYPIAYIRGRVSDAGTGKPISNARLVLKSDVSYHEAAGNTDAKGFFALKVRTDRTAKVSRLAVVGSHSDYLPDFAIAIENRASGPIQTINNVNVKLVRAVTISGRVIDEQSGKPPLPDSEIELQAEYPRSRELWGSKVGGKTEFIYLNPDGTFSIKTGIGKNRMHLIDSGGMCYGIKPEQQEFDVGPGGRPNFVLALVRRGCRREAYPDNK